ncbi:YdaS family helix-turn-helix protein [Cupriavidus sp. RAF12]|uniref:YdaS family helix-turn-helix protein n=1 Tax=Cupriavidus sp. RAF12 TaxID=3233050 RepID=UPI003F8E4395
MTHASTEAASPLGIAVSLAGSQTKLAESLNESQQNISNWLRNGIPGDKRAMVASKLERLYGERVGRKVICPDDWALIWPELEADVETLKATDDAQPPTGGAARTNGT